MKTTAISGSFRTFFVVLVTGIFIVVWYTQMTVSGSTALNQTLPNRHVLYRTSDRTDSEEEAELEEAQLGDDVMMTKSSVSSSQDATQPSERNHSDTENDDFLLSADNIIIDKQNDSNASITVKSEIQGAQRNSGAVPEMDITRSPYIDTKLYLNVSEDEEKKRILWWNAPGWLVGWSDMVDMSQCSYKNCKVSFDRTKFMRSDAVIFSLTDEGMDYKPPIPKELRNPDQAWIFFTLESPVHVQMARDQYMSPQWHDTFNWSWTYRPDADIFHPYGTLRTKENAPVRNYSDIFRRKKKMAAWAVSHCSTVSDRSKYVRILSKYAKVDIYGKCGMKTPPEFEKVLQENYKFYLGFENSLCTDYMTEKFFHYYSMDLITILRGKTNYTKNLPKGSYVNTDDFKTIRDLAIFLKDLASNESRYTEYLKNKDQFQVYERDFMYRNSLCSICEKLNNLDKYRKSYTSVHKWLGLCFQAQDLKEYR